MDILRIYKLYTKTGPKPNRRPKCLGMCSNINVFLTLNFVNLVDLRPSPTHLYFFSKIEILYYRGENAPMYAFITEFLYL